MGKNFINKLLPLALTATMIVPSVPAMAAPSDIAGHWAESVITQWQSKGLIQGYEDGTFKPGNTITRAELRKGLLVGGQHQFFGCKKRQLVL